MIIQYIAKNCKSYEKFKWNDSASILHTNCKTRKFFYSRLWSIIPRFHKYQDVFKPRVLPCIFQDFCFTWSCKHCYSICFGMRIKIFLHYGKENPQMHYTNYSVMSVCSRWLYPAKSNNIFKVFLTRESDACLH